MPTVERRRFRFRRSVEDADEGWTMIAHADTHGYTEAADPYTYGLTPWTCDPCGSTNTVPRLNCAFCGKPRA